MVSDVIGTSLFQECLVQAAQEMIIRFSGTHCHCTYNAEKNSVSLKKYVVNRILVNMPGQLYNAVNNMNGKLGVI